MTAVRPSGRGHDAGGSLLSRVAPSSEEQTAA